MCSCSFIIIVICSFLLVYSIDNCNISKKKLIFELIDISIIILTRMFFSHYFNLSYHIFFFSYVIFYSFKIDFQHTPVVSENFIFEHQLQITLFFS